MSMAPRPKTGQIDKAEAWIIATTAATYAQAAARFGLTHNAIRARISNKYGSLAMARLMREAAILKPDAGRVLQPVRRCMCCRKSGNMDRNQRICDSCKSQSAKLHDGRV